MCVKLCAYFVWHTECSQGGASRTEWINSSICKFSFPYFWLHWFDFHSFIHSFIHW